MVELSSPRQVSQMSQFNSSTVIYGNENSFNETGAENSQSNTSVYYYYGTGVVLTLTITMIICMGLALLGNFLVILTVIRHKGMRTRTNMFIVNLAIADILVAIFNMPFALTTVICGDWIFGDFMCQLNGFVTPLFFITSIHTLMHISIHKYISITKPFSQTMTNRKILVMICLSWSWAALCATTTVTLGNHVLYKKGSSQCGPSIPDELNEYIHSVMITTCNYILPLAVMLYCYVHIFCEIHEHMQRIRQTSNIDLENTLNQQRKITCTLFSVLACFLVCWTPFIIYSCSIAFLKNKKSVPYIANPVAYWCGYINSACNPIIYALRSPSFRNGYKEIICQYQTYNVGGSLITRPSISPYGTIKKLSSRISSNLISSIRNDTGNMSTATERKLLSDKFLTESIVEKMKPMKRNGITKDTPTLILSHQTEQNHREQHSLDNGYPVSKQRRRRFSLQLNTHFLSFKEKKVSAKESKTVNLKSKLFTKSHSFPLSSDNEFIQDSCFSWIRNHSEIFDDGKKIEKQNIDQAINAVSEQSFQSSKDDLNEDGAVRCPLVVIDAVSLQLSNRGEVESLDKNISNPSSIVGFSSVGLFQHSVSNEIGKWSPISIKSLERGRNRGSNSRSSKANSPDISHGGCLSTPQSPLYSASKEQLMKWMSEDNLDRLQENALSFGLGVNLLAGIRNIRRHHKLPLTESHGEREKFSVQRM